MVYIKYEPKKNFQLMKLLSLTIERKRSMHWHVLYVSLMRITKTSPLYIKSYYDGTLDLYILGYNMSNG